MTEHGYRIDQKESREREREREREIGQRVRNKKLEGTDNGLVITRIKRAQLHI